MAMAEMDMPVSNNNLRACSSRTRRISSAGVRLSSVRNRCSIDRRESRDARSTSATWMPFAAFSRMNRRMLTSFGSSMARMRNARRPEHESARRPFEPAPRHPWRRAQATFPSETTSRHPQPASLRFVYAEPWIDHVTRQGCHSPSILAEDEVAVGHHGERSGSTSGPSARSGQSPRQRRAPNCRRFRSGRQLVVSQAGSWGLREA